MSSRATTVAIVGAGPAGLTLANLLQRRGIDCCVVERQSREYVEQRQRAGVIEQRAIGMLEGWGLAEQVLDGARPQEGFDIRVDGKARFFACTALAGGRHLSSLPQQVLVQRLIEAYLAGGGGLVFDAADVQLHDLASDQPKVTYRSAAGAIHEIESIFVAGCDGGHWVSRQSVPAGELTARSHDYGTGWLTVLADTRRRGTLCSLCRSTGSPRTSRGVRKQDVSTCSAQQTTMPSSGPTSGYGSS